MTARSLAIVLALSGCQGILGLTEVPPPPDAPVDAAYLVCARQATPAFLCADFDEDTASVYVGGVATAMPPAGAGVVVMRQPPAISPPNAMSIDSTSDGYALDYTQTGSANATAMTATFDLALARELGANFEIFELGAQRDTANNCAAVVQVASQPPGIRLQAWCGQQRNPATPPYVVSGIPVGFHAYTLGYDLVAQQVSLSFDGGARVTVDLSPYAPTATPGRVRAGMLNVSGAAFALDDVVVTVIP